MEKYFVGVDIGGTFTDCVVLDSSGHVTIAKVLSTPPSFADGALNSVRAAAAQLGYSSEEDLLGMTMQFFHGCTVGDNAIYTRTGAKTGLITTKGFGDTLPMMRGDLVTGRQEEEVAHLAAASKPEAIVPWGMINEVTERIDNKGAVLVGLVEEDAKAAINELLAKGAEAIAVCLLWSFANTAHETKIKQLAAAMAPSVYVSLSTDVAPFLGEYERTATTTFNAYIGPLVSSYLESLKTELAKKGLKSQPLVMQSYGGVLNIDAARRVPIGTVESGPAAGVVAARAVGEAVGDNSLLAIDMGGTTFKVGLVKDGSIERETDPSLMQYRLLWSKVWVQSMGSGGGSIARVDPRSGLLKVGPEGAGALPGPVCYGRGGLEPTVTDANLVLGRLDPGYFLGGDIQLDLAGAKLAIEEKIADPLGLDVVGAALGMIRIVDAQMADLIKAATIRRGHDPRGMTLVAYGGAGPLHAVSLAKQLGIRKIVVPVTASVHSAFGLIMSEATREYGRTVHYSFPPPIDDLASAMTDLIHQAQAMANADGFSGAAAQIECAVDMRYRYQVNEITVPFEWENGIDSQKLEVLATTFDSLYEARYGKGAGYREAGMEIVALRVRGIGLIDRPSTVSLNPGVLSPSVHERMRDVHFPGVGLVPTKIVPIELLKVGAEVSGPAIVETPVTSIVLHPGDVATLDDHGHLLIDVGGQLGTSTQGDGQ